MSGPAIRRARPESHSLKNESKSSETGGPKPPADFLTLLWLREPVGSGGNEPKPCPGRLLHIACNFCRRLRVGMNSQPRMASWAAATPKSAIKARPGNPGGQGLKARLN